MLRARAVSIVEEDALRAGRDAGIDLLEELGEAPDLAIVFGSSRYNQARLIEGLGSALPASTKLVGCSSNAEVDSREALVGSVAVMGLKLGGAIGCETFRLEGPLEDAFASGKAFGARIREVNPSVVLLFPDGLARNNAPFLLGMQESLGARFPILGGVAGEDLSFRITYEYEGRSVISGGVVAAALTGPIEIAAAARAGFQPVGGVRTCTRVEGGRSIQEIDGLPALELYRQYLGTRADDMPAVGLEFPLGVVGGTVGSQRLPAGEAISLIRAVWSYDERTHAISTLGEMPEGARISMTRVTKDDLLRAAEEATEATKKGLPEPDLALIFSCAGRKLVLGARFKEEIQRVYQRLDPALPKIGFYTYGELSPVEGVTMYHDETFTIAFLREKR